jgi:LPXTG-motif cell wall-anchored protein
VSSGTTIAAGGTTVPVSGTTVAAAANELPRTGTASGPIAIVAVIFLAIGLLFIGSARRRRS